MADFNVDLASPHASGAKAIQPVQDANTNFPNPLIGLGLGLAEIFVKNKGEQEKAEKEARENAVIGEFTQSQTALSDAVAQGQPVARVNAMARANYSKFAANYPHLVDKISKVNENLFQNTELQRAKSASETAVEVDKALTKSAVEAGYPIGEFTPPLAKASMLEAHQETIRADAAFRKLAEKRRFLNEIDSADRATEEARIKNEGTKLLSTLHDSQYEAFQSVGLSLFNKSKASGNPTEALIELNGHYSKVISTITGLSASNPELARVARQNFEEVYNFNKDLIEGKVDQTTSENRFKLMRNKAAAMAMDTSPQFKAMVGVTAALGGDATILMRDKDKAGLDAYLNLIHKYGGDVQSIVGKSNLEDIVYPSTLSQIRNAKSGNLPNSAAAMNELGRVGTNTLQTLGREGARVPFEKLNKTMDFISRPEFYDLISAGKVDKQAAADATYVFQQTYVNGVEKVLDAKLNEPFVGSIMRPQGQKYKDMVDFKWNGVSVVPEKVDQGTGKMWLNPNARAEMDVFMKELDKPTQMINQLVRAGAHLEGHNDYAKYWENNKHMLLPQMYPDPTKLKVGQIVEFPDGSNRKYTGGNFKDEKSYQLMKEKRNE